MKLENITAEMLKDYKETRNEKTYVFENINADDNTKNYVVLVKLFKYIKSYDWSVVMLDLGVKIQATSRTQESIEECLQDMKNVCNKDIIIKLESTEKEQNNE